jgi:hypothetical protein
MGPSVVRCPGTAAGSSKEVVIVLRKILIGLAVAVACGLAVLLGAPLFVHLLGLEENPPDDPAEVSAWAQANNLLTAADVEAVLGPGTAVAEGWIREDACPSNRHDSVGVSYGFAEDEGVVGECVIFETGEEVYASIDRDLPVEESVQRYDLDLVGADIVAAFAYDEGFGEGPQAVIVSTRDLVIFIEGGADTREQAEALAQTAVDKFAD